MNPPAASSAFDSMDTHFQRLTRDVVSAAGARHSRTVWLMALVWSSVILATLWGIFLADPKVHAPNLVVGLGMLWLAGMGAILFLAPRAATILSPDNPTAAREFIYRLIASQTTAAIGIVDRYGRFSLVNEAFCQIFGCSPEELIGQKLMRFVHPEDHPLVREQLKLRRRGFSSTYQGRIVRKDGQIRWILAAVSPIYDSFGNFCGGLGLATDITEQKQAEIALHDYNRKLQETVQQLEEARLQAQEALKTKDHFLASVTHELRTPLTAILGYAETLLIDGDLSKAPPTRIAAIQTILRNGKYLLQIINDILELAKTESGRLPINLQDVPLIPLVQDVMRLMEVRAAAKGLPLRLEIRGVVPRQIHSDPVRLRQILINLIANAIKFTESGAVRLVVQVPKNEDGTCQLQCEVIDTGVGIPADLCEKIFEPFHRAGTHGNNSQPGTGLGLALSRNLARRLGGDITVVSEVGLGSNFRVTLPLGPAEKYEWIDPDEIKRLLESRTEVEPAGPQRTCRRFRLAGRVLLVDDCPETLRLFDHILRLAGLDVTAVDRPRQALQLALDAMVDGRPFDCILLDMQMPELDGYQLAQMLRQSGYQAPIVALTAGSGPGEKEKCIAAGCDDFASKPLSRCTLHRLMAKYAARIFTKPCQGENDQDLVCLDSPNCVQGFCPSSQDSTGQSEDGTSWKESLISSLGEQTSSGNR